MEDASLDDFRDGGTTSDDTPSEGGTASDDSSSDGDGTDPPTEDVGDSSATADGDGVPATGTAASPPLADGADDVDPARSTMTVTPGGSECDHCGERVQRRWTDDAALVCRDCKEW